MNIKEFLNLSTFTCKRGFTITEVSVVIAIIALLAVGAASTVLSMRPTKNMRSDGRDILSALQQAKLEAIKRNTCVGVLLFPAAAPPADLTGDANRGSYMMFIDDGRGFPAGACDAVLNGTEANNPLMPANPLVNASRVREGVALTRSPTASTAADLNLNELFDSISFDNRGLARARTPDPVVPPFNAIVLRNDPNPANPTWWGRVVANNVGGSILFQTNNNPANQNVWSD